MTISASVLPRIRIGDRLSLARLGARRRPWSLAREYLLASLVVVLGGVLITGAWIGHQIESSVLDRTAGITALYVDSVVSPNVQALATDDRWISATDLAALDRLVTEHGPGPGGCAVQDLVAGRARAVLARPVADWTPVPD